MRFWGHLFGLCLVSTLVASFSIFAALPENEWSQVLTPSRGETHSIGFYANGCLAGAKTLPLEGVGYQVMRPARNRYYGQPQLIQYLETYSALLNDLGSAVLIGDLGQPRGGPMPSGHASHQVGLDVDIWFWTHPEQDRRLLTPEEREQISAPTVLDSSGAVNVTSFTKDQVLLKLQTAAQSTLVQRIFVNPAIKYYLCKTVPPQDHLWLHKLRPWPGHDEHFHVRLYCPINDKQCIHQIEAPEGDGCDEIASPFDPNANPSMEMFSMNLDLPAPKRARVQTLPPGCAKVLKE